MYNNSGYSDNECDNFGLNSGMEAAGQHNYNQRNNTNSNFNNNNLSNINNNLNNNNFSNVNNNFPNFNNNLNNNNFSNGNYYTVNNQIPMNPPIIYLHRLIIIWQFQFIYQWHHT